MNESYIDIEFGCPICGEVNSACNCIAEYHQQKAAPVDLNHAIASGDATPTNRKFTIAVNAITVKPEDIPATLLEMRRASGLTQRSVAERAGFAGAATTHNYESGARGLTCEKLDKILIAYGFRVDSITFRKVSSG